MLQKQLQDFIAAYLERDAYIVGVNVPVKSFNGTVVAVIHRSDDVEDKWVVAPEDMVFTEDDIKKSVHFTEQFFLTEYYCSYTKFHKTNTIR